MELNTPSDVSASELLLELTRVLASSLDCEESLRVLAERLATATHVDRVSIVLTPQQSGVGYVIATSDDPSVTHLRLELWRYPEIAHAATIQQTLCIDDPVEHPLLREVCEGQGSLSLRSLTLIPIVAEGQTLGVMVLRATQARRPLPAELVRTCEVLASTAALALRHARSLQSLRDVTERGLFARRETEQRLDTLKRYAHVFSSSADGLAVVDHDGRFLVANPSANRILGFAASLETIETPLWDLIPKDMDARRSALVLQRQLGEGLYPRDFDLPIVRRDGQTIVLNASFSPLEEDSRARLLSFRDVTAERKTREELVHTRNFLQSLIDASVDAIVAADMKGTIILFNKGAQQLYGYRPEDAIGTMNVRALYPGDGAREVMRMLRSQSHGGVGRLEPVRTEAINSGGQIFPISLTSAMIYEGGRPVATFGIFTDLRERARVEHQLAEAQERLASSAKQALVAELAGAAAHELNQPLTSVMGYSELLLRKLPRESANYRSAEVIHGEAGRMAEIVRKIGKLTRYETKSYVGDQRILDLDRASQGEAERSRGTG